MGFLSEQNEYLNTFENCLQDLPNPDAEFFTWSCVTKPLYFPRLYYIIGIISVRDSGE
jgi:hypothetical protein